MEVNGSPGEEEEMMMIMSKGKHPFSSPPCSSSSHPYHQYHNDRQPPPSEEEAVVVAVEKEHMFDKVVTPSDVGKLNRLVIPKQHAERYFPLDSASHEKGLLLSFEDLSGKPWSFRYSYWNSSQSYVMTKGWSRFVKDKKLDAGDVVSFHRARDKLFIDWRRRPDPPSSSSLYQYLSPVPSNCSLFMPPPPPILHGDGRLYWPNHHLGGYPSNNSSVIYMRPVAQHQGGSSSAVMDPRVYKSVPVVQAAAHKRLRLFGVNMDICPITTTNCDAHHQIEDRSSSTTISFSAAGGRNS